MIDQSRADRKLARQPGCGKGLKKFAAVFETLSKALSRPVVKQLHPHGYCCLSVLLLLLFSHMAQEACS
jgi:hypothetical protein